MNIRDKADVAIIGGGIGGIMTAYRLLEKNPELKVSVIERGHDIEKRICPMLTKKTDHCIKCATCAIMEGMAGAALSLTVNMLFPQSTADGLRNFWSRKL